MTANGRFVLATGRNSSGTMQDLGTLDDDETMVGEATTWPWTCYVLAEAPDRDAVSAVCSLVRELQADGTPLWKYLKVEARLGRPLFFAEPS